MSHARAACRKRLAQALIVGVVGIDEGFISTKPASFGRVEESGIGRERSRHGIDAPPTTSICFGGIAPR